jgi:serine/threonine-protein kinase
LSGRLGDDREAVAVDVVRQISAGLGHAHELGFVHRDVTPRNILGFVSREDVRWCVGDWGAVRRAPGDTTHRLTRTNEGIGTAGFAAPETWRDAHSADRRADVYSLGRVAAWLTTGTWPQPNLALLPAGPLRPVVAAATHLDPDRRTESMARLEESLASAMAAPVLEPEDRLSELVAAINVGRAHLSDAIAFAMAHEDDEAIWIDVLPGTSSDEASDLAEQDPASMAAAASVMASHLVSAQWRERNFDYANVPLAWIFAVLKTLVESGNLDLAEDVGAVFFEAAEIRDRYHESDVTSAWLARLNEHDGAVMARALRTSGAADYSRRSLDGSAIRSRAIARELRI